MRVVQFVELSPEGAIRLRWTDTDEHGPEGTEVHETLITPEGREMYQHVGYYAAELYEDTGELLEWWLKYRKGIVRDS